MFHPGVIASAANIGAGGGGGGDYVASAVHFANKNMLFALEGITSSEVGTVSAWIKTTSRYFTLAGGYSKQFEVVTPGYPGPDDNLAFPGLVQESEDTNGLFYVRVNEDLPSPAVPTINDDVWHHCMWRWETGHNSGSRIAQFAVDGVYFPVSDDIIITADAGSPFATWSEPFFSLQYVFGDGDMADVWIGIGQSVDLSVPANIAKFIHGGKPKSLGTDGSLPTGIAPAAFFTGDATAFPTNSSPGVGFNVARCFVSVNGSNGAGTISIPGALIGSPVVTVFDNSTSAEMAGSFESVITVADQIQQTAATDLSADFLDIYLQQGTLTDASTSPSD